MTTKKLRSVLSVFSKAKQKISKAAGTHQPAIGLCDAACSNCIDFAYIPNKNCVNDAEELSKRLSVDSGVSVSSKTKAASSIALDKYDADVVVYDYPKTAYSNAYVDSWRTKNMKAVQTIAKTPLSSSTSSLASNYFSRSSSLSIGSNDSALNISNSSQQREANRLRKLSHMNRARSTLSNQILAQSIDELNEIRSLGDSTENIQSTSQYSSCEDSFSAFNMSAAVESSMKVEIASMTSESDLSCAESTSLVGGWNNVFKNLLTSYKECSERVELEISNLQANVAMTGSQILGMQIERDQKVKFLNYQPVDRNTATERTKKFFLDQYHKQVSFFQNAFDTIFYA